jgi:hypothetical protein
MRAVVNVATGHYVRGQERLTETLAKMGEDYFVWRDRLPVGSPEHRERPYAFKAFAMGAAEAGGATTLLWADACILPIRPLGPLWELIERQGYWIGNNGFTNYEWTADSAYSPLFGRDDAPARELNKQIKHVVATTFGVNLKHPTGRRIFDEYFNLAAYTGAFCGPWVNREPLTGCWLGTDEREGGCGPTDVRGHRHDQTALSVIAWRHFCKLTNSPEIFSYDGGETEKTILVANSRY